MVLFVTDPRPLVHAADPATLRQVFGCFPSGVVAVCAEVDGRPVGMAVSSFTSVSLDPPLVSICVDRGSSTWPTLRLAPRLGLSVLNERHDIACRQLSSKDGDRFAGLPLRHTLERAILIDGATAWLDCSHYAELEAGDHDIALLRIRALSADPTTGPLVFHRSRFHRLAAS
jgi:flavin reductase (DIM6/NTAB) family NADH-FMN oxidoreductase RutF